MTDEEAMAYISAPEPKPSGGGMTDEEAFAHLTSGVAPPNPANFKPEPMSRAVPKAPDLVRTLPPSESMSGGPADPYEMMAAMQGEGSVQQSLSPLEGLDSVLKQTQQYVGRPVANAIIDTSKYGPLRAPVEAALGPQAADLLQRRALGLLGGDLTEGMTDQQRLQATNQLEDTFGTTGGAFAQGLAEQASFAPMYALAPEGMAAGARVGEQAAVAGIDAGMFPTLTSVLAKLGRAGGSAVGGAVEGAALGGLQAGLTPGQTVQEGLTAGALFGAGLGLAGPVMGAVVARLRPGEQQALGREVAALPLDSPGVQVVPAKLVPKDLAGASYTVGVTPEGDVFARVYKLGNEKVTIAELPLDTEADAAHLAKLVKEHGLSPNIPAEVWASDAVRLKSHQWEWNVWGQEGEFKTVTVTGKAQREALKAAEAAKAPTEIVPPEQVLRAVEPTNVGRVKTPKELPRITAQPLDAPPPDIVPTQDVEVLADGTMRPAEPPAPPAPPPAPPAAPPPTQVYIRANNDRGYLAGEVLGTDARGNLRVRTNTVNGETHFVPPEEVWPVEPTVTPRTLTAPPVPPPPPVAPGQLAPVAVERARLAQRVAQRLGAGAEKFLNGVMGKGLRGAEDLASFIQSTMGTRALQETGTEAMRLLRSTLRRDGVLMSAFDRDLEQAFLGRLDMPTLWKRYPKAAERARAILEPIKQEIDANERRIAELGGIPDSLVDLRDNGEIDRYLARLYLKHTLGEGQWAKFALRSDRLMRPAADELVAQLTRNGHYATPAMVQGELERIVGAPNAMEAMANSEVFKAAYGNRLRRLQDIPQVFRDLMGEIHSGQYRIAVTLGSQRAIVANLELMQELAANRAWSNVGEVSGWQQLRNNPRYYGRAAGMWVRPEIYDALVNLPKMQDQMPGIVRKLYGFQRSNYVGLSPGVVMRNTLEDVWHSVLAGGLDPFRPAESGQAMLRALEAMRDHLKNPAGDGPGKLVLEAKKFNAVNAGWGQTESNTVHAQFLDHARELLRAEGGRDMWSVLDALQTAASKYRKFIGKTAEVQDVIAQTMRMANYLSLMDKHMAAPGTYGLREALGMTKGLGLGREEAARLASLKINQSFQNPTNLGPAVNKLRNPLFGPFFPSIADEIRVWGHAAARLRSEPELRWRLGALVTFFGGLYGANSLAKHLNGISPEDEARAQSLIPDSQKGFHPALVTAPWRDERTGQPQVYDLSPFSTALSLLQGNPDSPMWNRVLANVVKLPVNGGLGEEPVDAALTRAGIVRPFGPDGQPKLLEGEAGLVTALNYLNQKGGLLPSGVTRVVNAARQMSPTGIPRPQPVTPGQAAQYAAGIPVVTPKSNTAAVLEKVGQLKEASGEYKRAVMQEKQQYMPDITKRVQDVGKKFNPPK